FSSLLTTTNEGPFPQWDATGVKPPAGYVGDPNVTHSIIGSPLGTNVFRIDGPNVGGPGINTISTDQFAITGKLNQSYPRLTHKVSLEAAASTDAAAFSLHGDPDPLAEMQAGIELRSDVDHAVRIDEHRARNAHVRGCRFPAFHAFDEDRLGCSIRQGSGPL